MEIHGGLGIHRETQRQISATPRITTPDAVTAPAVTEEQSKETHVRSGATQTEKRRSATRWVVALTGIGSLRAALDTLVVATSLSTITVASAREAARVRVVALPGQRHGR